MSGDSKRGDAVGDKWSDVFARNRKARENALLRRDFRADMRSNPDEEENSAVIEQRALEEQKRRERSDPPSGVTKGFFGLAKGMKSDWAKVVAFGILAGFLLGAAYLAAR